ncbi:DUF6624 domain-containing protein [Rhodocaloribacter sp.]
MDAVALGAELLSMAEEDLRLREEPASDGRLFEGYHPRMRELHERHAERLSAILDAHGWPGRSLVGEKAADAAWLILQHAISQPSLQRRALELLSAAAASGDVPPVQVAMLEDRIRVNEGRPQRYGTQFDWDEHGRLSPLPIEEGDVDERRREVGLGPLAADVRRMRARAAREGEQPPPDWAARQREKEAWLRAVGRRTRPIP